MRPVIPALAAVLWAAAPAMAQQTSADPFPTPIPANEGVVRVSFREFASLPDFNNQAARMMILVDEPGTKRLFVNDMRGPIYSISYDGKAVASYVDTNAPQWGHPINSQGNERGMNSFAFHPQFAQAGTPGYGKFYTFTDTSNMTPTPDYRPEGPQATHHTVLLEWTAKTPAAATYDGGPPRELLRMVQPFGNHNAGQIAFNPNTRPGGPDFGLLYISFADGGSGGDPMNMAQNMASIFGKMLRIDPLGNNSANKKYGIPASNPFVADKNPRTLDEIYVVGLRNPQRFAWDSRNGNLFVADIGQNIVEEVSVVTAGSNAGWNVWEGSFRYVGRQGVDTSNPRGDAKMVYPVAEYGQMDPLLQGQSAVTMGYVYRQSTIPQLANLVIFGDNPSGEIFYINADKLPPQGGQDAIRRILLNDNGTAKTLLQVIQEKNKVQSRTPATRVDLRFGSGPNGQIFLLNKRDGTIRLLVPDGTR